MPAPERIVDASSLGRGRVCSAFPRPASQGSNWRVRTRCPSHFADLVVKLAHSPRAVDAPAPATLPCPSMRLLVLLNPLSGLGHAAVVGGILRGLRRSDPGSAAVVVSGGPPLPPGLLPDDVDLVQLPALQPTRGLFAELAPRTANLDRSTVRKMRRKMLLALLRTFRPDLVLVEHFPFGRHAFLKEMVPLLEEIATRLPDTTVVSSLAVLGGRAPEHRREELVVELARRFFHRVLVHTDPSVEPLAEEYPEAGRRLADLVRHTGYVLPRPIEELPHRERTRAHLGVGLRERLVVAHAGGGKDGAPVLRVAIDAARHLGRRLVGPKVRFLAVAGAAMPGPEVASLEEAARRDPRIRFERYRPDLFACVTAADAVISMAGYASAAEILAARVPAVLVPRRTDDEQVRRARRLASLGLVRVLPEGAGGREASRLLRELLDRPAVPPTTIDLSGAATAAREILSCGGTA